MKDIIDPAGKPFRHQKLVAWGSAAATIASGASGNLSFNVSEEGIGGRIVLPEGDYVLTDIKHGSRSLISGVVPSDLFAQHSLCNPRMFRVIEKADGLFYVTAKNTSAAAMTISAGITSPPLPGEHDDYDGDASRPGTREVLAAGCDAEADLAAGASNQFTIDINEVMDAAYLVVGSATNLDTLVVTELKVGNREFIDSGSEVPASLFAADNPDNPLLAVSLSPTDDVVITVKNNHAANQVDSVACCITTG